MSVGVIGNGVVGGCLARYLGSAAKVYDRDPARSLATLDDAVTCDTVFVCIWLPQNADNGGELDTLRDVLGRMQAGATAVLRCTVVPGTCDALQAEYPGLRVCFMPEFLREASAEWDFLHPNLSVAGVPPADVDLGSSLLDLVPAAPNRLVMTPLQAEWLKLSLAGYLSTKVSFFNQLYDALGENFGPVVDAMRRDPRVGADYTRIFQDGYRGWGGKCFTKDTPCFADAHPALSIVREAVAYNNKLRRHDGP